MTRRRSNTDRSRVLFSEASKVIPGGVNSPVRAFGSVGGHPLFMRRAEGPYLWDVDGNRYIDFINSWGPAILGHSHPEVLEAVIAAARDGFSFGAPTERETQLAERVIAALPSIEMLRFVSSGTEACMSALRLARAFTGRTKIIKFSGCYHGHADMLLVASGSGVATLGIAGSPGVPSEAVKATLTAEFNDLAAVESLFESSPNEIAAVILEPIVGNAGFIRPLPGFLEGLRSLCTRFGSLLIFDEVMTGFRVAFGGVQSIAVGGQKVKPDLTVLGKVIGGGMPLAAYGGRRDIMAMVAPSGPMYQAGTLSGNPVATACGLATLEVLSRPGVFAQLTKQTRRFVDGLKERASAHNIPLEVDAEGGMFGFFFSDKAIHNYSAAKHCQNARFQDFFWAMLERGVYLAPSPFEAGFVSTTHNDEVIQEALDAVESEFKLLADVWQK